MGARLVALLASSAVAAIAVQPGGAESWVQGVAYERTGTERHPLSGTFVSAWSSFGQLLGTTRTDAAGRYQFVNLPQARFTLEASRAGYLTLQAAGRAGSRATLDCSRGCRQSGLDFELSRGAVVAGAVLDAMGDPVSRAAVSLRNVAASPSNESASTGATDDRGRFRIAGLSAGAYTLTVQRRTPTGQDETLSKSLNVREGESVADLQLVVGGQGSFRVAGSVSGIPFGEGYRTWVEIRPLSGSTRALQANVGQDGRFRFDSVIAGRYSAGAAVVKVGTVERSDYFLDAIDVQTDTDGITLQPIQPATALGSLEVAAGALPPGAVLRFTSKDGFGSRWARVRGAQRQYELTGLRPGAYRVETDSAEFYVKGIKTAGETGSPDGVILSPGPNRLTVLAAADQAQVLGTVLGPEQGRPLPYARIALSGDRGKYTVQADQAGHFMFGKVIPGEYHICAWTNIAPERVDDAVTWEKTGCQLTAVTIDPFGRVEIDIPASP